MMAALPGTTIIVRPAGATLSWEINTQAPTNNSGAAMPSFAHQRVRSFRADVQIGGYIVYGVNCTQIRAQLTTGDFEAVIDPLTGTLTWYLATSAYAKPGPPLSDTYWPFDLAAQFEVGGLEAYVRYGVMGGPATMQWAPATQVTIELD
jgi:hypothetical protein